MDRVTLKNFRCFRKEQVVRLAPLTLLVGENSTGKTSFMALIRALWDEAFGKKVPDFKELPYDLGSFDDIAHHRGGRGGRADSFDDGIRCRCASRIEGFDAGDWTFPFRSDFWKERYCTCSRETTYLSRGDLDRVRAFHLAEPYEFRSWNQPGELGEADNRKIP